MPHKTLFFFFSGQSNTSKQDKFTGRWKLKVMSICGTRNVAGANVSTSGLVFFGSLTSFLIGMLVPATFPVPPLLITSKQNMAHMKAAISLECSKTF